MVTTEYFETREDGVVLVRTYSTEGKYIIQDGTGIQYAEAIDPVDMHRTYTESDNKIPVRMDYVVDEEMTIEEDKSNG